MRTRTWLILSVGLNLAFGFGWYLAARPAVPPSTSVSSSNTNKPEVRYKTAVVVRSQNFTWQEVESADYVTYIKNLRDIGCPEQTIRDIIVADVNQLYARRKATEVISTDYQWWLSDPDTNLLQKASAKIQELDTERKTLLVKLLGPEWDADPSALPQMVRLIISLSGPVLGDLAPEIKQSVYSIALKTQEKIDAYIESQRQQNKAPDMAELDRIRESSRTELAAILKPAELEEYLLRYSKTARGLRDELRGLDSSSDEFRTLFRSLDSIETQAAYHYSGEDPALIKQREELEAKRNEILKTTLGKDRYEQYSMNRDPVYQEAKSTAENLGVESAQVLPIYQINSLTQNEMDRIRKDDTLSNEEKVEALAAAQVEQQKALEKIMGAEAFERWLQSRK
jgi:hypothetical protein